MPEAIKTVKKNVKYDYFRVYSFESKKKLKFNFEEWVHMYNEKFGIYSLNEDLLGNIKFKILTLKIEGDMAFIQISKAKENETSSIITDKSHRDLELKPEEYIGENMFILYDKKNGIMMVQNNRYSLSLTQIKRILTGNYTSNNLDIEVSLFPILRVNKGSIKNKLVKNYNLSIYNDGGVVEGKSALASAVNSFMSENVVSVSIKITTGRGRFVKDKLGENTEIEKYIEADKVDDFQKFISENESLTTNAKMGVKTDSERNVELIDLLQDKYSSIIRYNVVPKHKISFEYAKEEMKKEYLRVKEELISPIEK